MVYIIPKLIVVMPSLQRKLGGLGENIRLARLRRRLSAAQVAERAGLSRQTVSAIEHGDASVTIGSYASVLLVLGLDTDLTLVAADDVLGRRLQEADLTVKKRAPRTPRSGSLGPERPKLVPAAPSGGAQDEA